MSDLPQPVVEAHITHAGSPQPERRTRIYHALDELMEKRQEALLTYTHLAAQETFEDIEAIRVDLRSFCQALLDYAALEQFEIFDAYSNGNERRIFMQQLAEQHYTPLKEMTSLLVGFNDKYDGSESHGNVGQLSDDLYAMGDLLAQRIEEEDRFIRAVLQHSKTAD